ALIGVLGFIPGITVASAEHGGMPGEGLLLGIFGVDYLHDVSHILFGAILIYGGLSAANVSIVNKVMAVIFAVLVVAAFIKPLADLVAVNLADSLLHLVSALLSGYLGFVATRTDIPQ